MNNSYFYLNDSCMEQYDKNELIKFIKSKGKFDDKKTYEFIEKGLKRKSSSNNLVLGLEFQKNYRVLIVLLLNILFDLV